MIDYPNKYLDNIFGRLSSDTRVTVWHISLYMSLFYLWQKEGLKNPFQVSRRSLMKLSHIKSFVTYHKCIRQLTEFGYIIYEPSYDPFIGSRVSLLTTRK
jgi:hypothetical protein